MAIHLNTHGIDQNKTTKPSPGIAQGHFGRNPAAYRGAYDQHIPQVEPFEQLKIGNGEIIKAIEPLRAWFALKARVYRHQDVRSVQPCGYACHGLRATTTMQ